MGCTKVIRLERLGQVALLTLNRPAVHNALTPEMACHLVDYYDELSVDPDIHVLVVTGAGDSAFCSGGDLEKTLPLLTGARAAEDEWDRRILQNPDILTRAALRMDFAKPVIAAVNGYCLAFGLELLLATDIRVATEHAIFGLPEVRHALIPFAGALARLPRQIPACAAMEMLLVGEPISATEALRLGLINKIVSSGQALPRAMEMAERIAANGPLAVREIKRTVNAMAGMTVADASSLEDEARGRIMASADANEGLAAFVERRRPKFQGR
jgi:enoyl-CoA hydratase